MSVSVKSINCPDCGAHLQVEGKRDTIFCEYCGAKVMLTNDNEYIYRHVDEAEILRAETEAKRLENERLLKLKEIEKAEEAKKAAEKAKKTRMFICLGIVALGVIVMVLGITFGAKPDQKGGLFILGIILLIVALIIWISGNKKSKAQNK